MRYIEDSLTLKFDESLCSGCGMCEQVCPHGVFKVEGGRAHLADAGACIECGACARNCMKSAIRVKAGVGCAAAMITGGLRGSEPVCGCSKKGGSCC